MDSEVIFGDGFSIENELFHFETKNDSFFFAQKKRLVFTSFFIFISNEFIEFTRSSTIHTKINLSMAPNKKNSNKILPKPFQHKCDKYASKKSKIK